MRPQKHKQPQMLRHEHANGQKEHKVPGELVENGGKVGGNIWGKGATAIKVYL